MSVIDPLASGLLPGFASVEKVTEPEEPQVPLAVSALLDLPVNVCFPETLSPRVSVYSVLESVLDLKSPLSPTEEDSDPVWTAFSPSPVTVQSYFDDCEPLVVSCDVTVVLLLIGASAPDRVTVELSV